MIRTAYGLRGSAADDACKALFFPCCSVNQLFQTSKQYGNPSKSGGREYNQQLFRGEPRKKDVAYNCIISSLCNPCVTGSALDTAMGMPWCIGCACVNPFLARNIMRYHWRLKGNDAAEMLVPVLCLTIDQFVILPPAGIITFYGIGAMLVTMQLLAEVDSRGADATMEAKRYLTGYSSEGILSEQTDTDGEGEGDYEDVVGRTLMHVEAVPVTSKHNVTTPSAIISESTAVIQQQKH